MLTSQQQECGIMPDDEVKALLQKILDILPTLATKADLAAVEARLDAKVAALDAKVTALDAKVTALDARVTALDARVTSLRTEFEALRGEFYEFRYETRTELRVVSARLDEQRHILGALIPTQLAAVPRAAA